MKLYEISREYREALEHLEEVCDDRETIDNTLSSIVGSFEDKAKNIVFHMQNIESEILALQEHKNDIDSRLKKKLTQQANFRDYLKFNMQSCNITKIKSPFFDISLSDAQPALEIEDDENIPAEYFREVKEIVLDKARLKQDIKNGLEVKGVYLREGKRLLIRCS